MTETTNDFIYESSPTDIITVSRNWLKRTVGPRKWNANLIENETYVSMDRLDQNQIEFLSSELKRSVEARDTVVVAYQGFFHIFDIARNRYIQVTNLENTLSPYKTKDVHLPGNLGEIDLAIEPYTNDSLSFSATVGSESVGFQLKFNEPKNAPAIYCISNHNKSAKLLVEPYFEKLLTLRKPQETAKKAA